MAKRSIDPIDWENLKINENVYFYKIEGSINNALIQTTFTEALRDKNGEKIYKTILRQPFVIGKRSPIVSLEVFSFYQSPTFLIKPEVGILEQKFGLFLIIEYAGHVAILRKNISGAKALFSHISQIEHDVLSRCMLEPDSKIEHLTSDSMVAQNGAAQTKVSEAEDLTGTMSRYPNSKRIPRKLRIDNRGQKFGVTTTTSRINSFASGKKFKEALIWVLDTIDKLNKAEKKLPENELLDSFATPVKFVDERDALKLEYALLLTSELFNEIQEGIISEAFDSSNNINIELPKFLAPYTQLLALSEDSKDRYSSGELKVTYGSQSITENVSRFKDILLKGEGFETLLSDYIRTRKLFMYFFDKPEFAYYGRKLYKDNMLLGDTKSFLRAFEPRSEVLKIVDEKGKGYTAKSTKFSNKSLFGFIETTLAPKTCILVCDDLSTEWGDMIAISADRQIFYHAKSGNSELSASDLGVVFSQAQKNFGVIVMDRNKVEHRWPKWQNEMKLDGVQTKIHRVRRKPKGISTKSEMMKYIDDSVRNPNSTREVVIVLNYLSKNKLEDSLNKMKAGQLFADRGVTLQILWHVSALLANASELNAKFKIICKP